MAGVFESVIKTHSVGYWYIEITDTMDESAEAVHCRDVYTYAEKIEEMGKRYGGEIEVIWSSDEDVTAEQINEVRMQMNAYEAEQEAQRSQNDTLSETDAG